MAGEIYEYKTQNNSFATMMLRRITAYSLIVTLNDFEIAKRSRHYKRDMSENCPKTTYGYSKNEIALMQKEGTIVEINRE